MAGRKKLWGVTRINAIEIKIYKRWSGMTEVDGMTHLGKGGNIWIDVKAGIFDEPARLDDTLIHEFIHVLEMHLGAACTWHENSDNCSNAVRLLGSGLAQMLRELRQV